MNKKILHIIFRKRIIILFLFLLVALGYFGYTKFLSKSESTRYILTRVQKGTISFSVSGSGQIAASDQIDIKSKISSEVREVKVKENQEVKKGDLLIILDYRDAQKAVIEAENNLRSAELQLKNMKGKAQKSLDDAYSDALNLLATIFDKFSSTLVDLKSIFTESSVGSSGNTLSRETDIDYYFMIVSTYSYSPEMASFWREGSENKYSGLEKRLKELEIKYRGLNTSSSWEKVEDAVREVLEFTKSFLEVIDQTKALIAKYQATLNEQNLTPIFSTSVTTNQYQKVSEFSSSLSNYKNSLISLRDKISDRKEDLEKEEVDVAAQELTVKQREFDLEDAQKRLADHFIKSPIDGIVTNVDIKEGDKISSNSVLLTLITSEKLAKISFNEIDAVKIKEGQEAILSFDALPDITIKGKVVEIDAHGAVSQGVVSYNVKIALESDLEELKSGMSVTVEIITQSKSDALIVPNSALKDNRRGDFYVQVIKNPEAIREKLTLNRPIKLAKGIEIENRKVEVGIANDTVSEIISGLEEGEIIIVSTVENAKRTSSSAQSSSSQIRIPGLSSPQGQGSFKPR